MWKRWKRHYSAINILVSLWITKNLFFLIKFWLTLLYNVYNQTGVRHMLNSVSEVAQLWDKVLKRVEAQMGDKHLFDVLFSNSFIYDIHGVKVVVVINTQLAITLIRTKYNEIVLDALTEETGENFEIEYLLKEDVDKLNVQPGYTQAPEKKKQFFQNSIIKNDLTFDNFVVGDFNREAAQASLVIASNPGKMYNPLFMYSNSGLGKTHLMFAIANYVLKEKNPNAKILYMTGSDFVEEYVKFVTAEKDSETLKDFIASHDMLLFDDVQLLAGRVKTCEMFFVIYNYMVDHGKQVVFTSDRQPNELKDIDDRLLSRFMQGLVVKIDEPDQDTCVKILRKKIEESGLDINNFDENVLYFYADKFSKNVRELESALNRLIFTVTFMKKTDKITMDVAVDAVSSLVGGKQLVTQISEQKIINVVADYYNLAPSQLTGKIRTGQIALARHIAMYLIRNMVEDVSLKKIGDMFGGKDHTTVMNGISKVDKGLKTDETLREAVDTIKKRLQA